MDRMFLDRVNNEKGLRKPVERIELVVTDSKFTITPDMSGGFRIHSHVGTISILPGSRNEIVIRS